MTARRCQFDGIDCHVSRSGYTGEDGFEISVADKDAVRLWRDCCSPIRESSRSASARVIRCGSKPASASMAMTSMKTTSPVEAGLVWSIGKRRRSEGGFIGADRMSREIRDGRDAQARRHQAGRPRAGPRRHGRHRQRGRPIGVGHLGRLRADRQWPRRHGLCRNRLCRSRAPRFS